MLKQEQAKYGLGLDMRHQLIACGPQLPSQLPGYYSAPTTSRQLLLLPLLHSSGQQVALEAVAVAMGMCTRQHTPSHVEGGGSCSWAAPAMHGAPASKWLEGNLKLGQELPGCTFLPTPTWLGVCCLEHIPMATAATSQHYLLPKAVQQGQEGKEKLLAEKETEQYLGSFSCSTKIIFSNKI